MSAVSPARRAAARRAPPLPPRQLLTLQEACAYFHVDERTIRRWRHLEQDPLLASAQPGRRRIYFELDSMLDWIRRHNSRPTMETPRQMKRSAERMRHARSVLAEKRAARGGAR